MTFNRAPYNNREHSREHKEVPQEKKEEFAIVLDVVFSNQNSFKSDEIAQAIGTTNYTLLELVPKPGVILKTLQKVYIGDGKRDEIQYIKRSLFSDKMSSGAKSELSYAIREIVLGRESEYVEFFNKAGPISIRMHSLELIPGIGKKHMLDLLHEREKKPFESFEDIKARCTFFTDPAKAIVDRVIMELDAKDDMKIFVRK